MKLIYTLFLSLFVTQFSFSQLTQETIEINGTTRDYYQYLPTGYDPLTEQVPVLYVLHGLGGTAQQLTQWGFNPMADTARFILVFPQGKLNQYNQTAWNNGTLLSSTAEDLAFISQLMDHVNDEYSTDLSRVYMTGISMGAIMTYNCCRYMNDRIAAAVCHIGTMSTVDLQNYNPQYPVPILHKHGTNDSTVPYDGTPLPSLSIVQETIDQLKISNGFQGDSTVTALPDNVADGITVDRIVYNCTTPLELWRMNNADHIVLFQPTNDTTSTLVTWGFLQQFSHPNPSTAAIDVITATEANFYPNPVEDQLHLINYGKFTSASIYTVEGKLQQQVEVLSEIIDLRNIEPGVYIIHFKDIDGYIDQQRIIVQ